MPDEPSAADVAVTGREMDRRAFMCRVMAAGVGMPAALGLLSGLTGCDSATEAALLELVTQARATLANLQQEVLNTPNPTDATRQGWLNQINQLVADLWEAIAGAGDAERRGAVHPDMQAYLDRLDEWEIPLRTPEVVPQWSLQDLSDAAARARQILTDHPEADVRALALFVLIGCLLRPLWDDAQIYFTAVSAQQDDAEDASGRLFDLMYAAWQAAQPAGGEMRPACLWGTMEDQAINLGLSLLAATGMLWLWWILCNVAEDLAMYLAYSLGMTLLMVMSPTDALLLLMLYSR